MSVYKETEFKAFLAALESRQHGHGVEVARALNVDKNTISAWKKTPEAQAALQKGIDHALQCMTQAGARELAYVRGKAKDDGCCDQAGGFCGSHARSNNVGP
jgi:hypothetical protein